MFFLFKCFRNRSPSSHLHSIWRSEARLFCGGSPWIPRIRSPGRLWSPDPPLAPPAALHVWELRHRGLVQAKRRPGRVPVLRGDPLRQPDQPRAQHHRRPSSRNAGRGHIFSRLTRLSDYNVSLLRRCLSFWPAWTRWGRSPWWSSPSPAWPPPGTSWGWWSGEPMSSSLSTVNTSKLFLSVDLRWINAITRYTRNSIFYVF